MAEQYGSWEVRCGIQEGRKACIMSQVHVSSESRQRLFLIEVHPGEGGAASAIMAVPLGVRLAFGVKLDLDGQPFGPGHPFSTCVAQGCIADVVLGISDIEALGAGQTMKVAIQRQSDASPFAFAVDLDGFAEAFRRSRELEG